MQAVGTIASSPYFQHMLAPSMNDPPMVMVGKYLLEGALKMQRGGNQGQNPLIRY